MESIDCNPTKIMNFCIIYFLNHRMTVIIANPLNFSIEVFYLHVKFEISNHLIAIVSIGTKNIFWVSFNSPAFFDDLLTNLKFDTIKECLDSQNVSLLQSSWGNRIGSWTFQGFQDLLL